MVRSSASRPLAFIVAALLCLAAQGLSASPRAGSADLAITGLTASPTPGVMVGSNSTYTISFTSNGPDTPADAEVKLPTPANTTFVSAAITGGTGWSLTTAPVVGGTGDVIFTRTPGPASGATAQFQVVVTVDAATHHYEAITATASTYTTDPLTSDPVGTNNSATVATRAMIVADPDEPNDTPAQATVIPKGTTSNRIYSMDWNWTTLDTDWYHFCVGAGDVHSDLKVNVKITSAYPSSPAPSWRSDLDYALYDSTLTLKALAISGSDNETLYLNDINASSCYYINVPYATVDYAEGFGWGRYEITIETGTGTSFGIGYIKSRIMSSDAVPVPLAGVQIAAYDVPFVQTNSYPTVTSDADGYFTLPVAAGIRDLYFTGNYSTPPVNVVEEYYSDQDLVANATHVDVYANTSTLLGAITMDIGAIVSGTVTDGSGTPLHNAKVHAFNPANVMKGYTLTDTSGNYSLMGVPIGGAKIRFYMNSYAIEFYDDQPTFGTASNLNYAAGGGQAGINAVLTSGGTISGTVTDATGAGQSVPVYLYSVLDGTYSYRRVTSTAGTGAYAFGNTKAGDYKIYVNPTGTNFAPEWFNDATSFATATPVTALEGQTVSGKNIVLGALGGGSDYTGDRKADIMWRGSAGDLWLWTNNGTTSPPASYVSTVGTAYAILAARDFTGDGKIDLLWRHTTAGDMWLWTMNGSAVTNQEDVATVDPAYVVVGTGDFDGDAKADLLWRGAAGDMWMWLMNGAAQKSSTYVATVPLTYTVEGVGDLDGDGRADLVWRGSGGDLWAWLMNGAAQAGSGYLGTVAVADYDVEAVADFDGDRKADVLWRRTAAGDMWLWRMNGTAHLGDTYVDTVDASYQVVEVGDFDGDLKADLLWRGTVAGDLWIWVMNGATVQTSVNIGTVADMGYQVVR